MPESALGRGLEALIQDSQEEEKKSSKKKETKKKTTSKKKEPKKESKKKTTQKKNTKKDDNKLKEEVKENPRISLWSVKSAAVFKYMKKTIPEFSISNEASIILDEAIAKKYPEIWELFDDME